MNLQELEKEALEHFKKVDPVMFEITHKVPPLEWHPTKKYFERLLESIVSQQLSVKAADTIWGRFVTLFENSNPTPKEMIALDPEIVRKAGLSYSKIQYCKNIATHIIDSPKAFETFDEMSEEEIITDLVQIKGVGRWTAEMFLIFTMGRPDVFSYGDLGLRRAIERLYNVGHDVTKEEAEYISFKWKPYRSVASRYLWKSLEL